MMTQKPILSYLMGYAQSLCMVNLRKFAREGFEQKKDTFRFNGDFMENYYEVSDARFISEIHVKYLKQQLESHSDLPLSPERMNCKKYLCSTIRKNMSYT